MVTKKQEHISTQEHKRLQQILYDELERKNKLIDELRLESHATLKAALKQAQQNRELAEANKQLMQENRKLNAKLKRNGEKDEEWGV